MAGGCSWLASACVRACKWVPAMRCHVPFAIRHLRRATHWLGTCASLAPTPLPLVQLPERFDACHLLAHWLQVCAAVHRKG